MTCKRKSYMGMIFVDEERRLRRIFPAHVREEYLQVAFLMGGETEDWFLWKDLVGIIDLCLRKKTVQ